MFEDILGKREEKVIELDPKRKIEERKTGLVQKPIDKPMGDPVPEPSQDKPAEYCDDDLLLDEDDDDGCENCHDDCDCGGACGHTSDADIWSTKED